MMARRTFAVLLLAALAIGCGGHGECGGGAHSELSIWPEQQRKIGVTFTLTGARPGSVWGLVVVHEGHVRWRGHVTANQAGTVKLTRHMGDYAGADHVSVRAYGHDGGTCDASADLPAAET